MTSYDVALDSFTELVMDLGPRCDIKLPSASDDVLPSVLINKVTQIRNASVEAAGIRSTLYIAHSRAAASLKLLELRSKIYFNEMMKANPRVKAGTDAATRKAIAEEMAHERYGDELSSARHKTNELNTLLETVKLYHRNLDRARDDIQTILWIMRVQVKLES